MRIKKSSLTFSLILLAVSLVIAGIILSTYKTILSLTPIYQELEIQFYATIVILIITSFSFLYKFSFYKGLSKIKKRFYGNITIPKKTTVLLLAITVMFLINFQKNIYINEIFQLNLRDLGIKGFSEISYPFFIVVTLLLFLFFSSQIFLKKILRKSTQLYYIVSFALIIIISFSIKNFNAYDYAYFAGPINDLLHGRHLLYDIPSQYGFLSIVFLSALFKFIELNLFNIVLVNSVTVTLGFCLIFTLLQFIYKSKALSLFVILTTIFFNYIVQIETRGDFPQTNFIRFGIWVLIGLLIAFQNSTTATLFKRKIKFILILSLGISFFWVVDNGLYILLAYISYVTFNNLQPSLKNSFKKTLPEIIKPIVFIMGIFVFINLIYALYFNIPINWNHYFSDAKYYISGFGLIPFPDSYLPWIMIITYLITLIYLYTKKRFDTLSKQEILLSFVLFYGIFQFLYFMGRSHLNNLHHVIIPFLICFFYLLEELVIKIKEERSKLWKLSTALLLSLLLSVPFYLVLLQGISNFQGNNLIQSIQTINNKNKVEEENFKRITGEKTFEQLISRYGDYIRSNGITIVSVDDTWYLIKLNTINNINSNNLAYYIDEKDLIKLAESIIKNNDQYIFISPYSESARKEVKMVYSVMNNHLEIFYKFKESIGSLNVWELKEKSL